MAMKRMKKLEKDLEQLNIKICALENQRDALEESITNVEMVKAMKKTTKVLKNTFSEK